MPEATDGGAIDTGREIVSGVLNNLFPDLSAAELAAGGTRYRKLFRRNEHATETWGAVRTYIAQQPGNAAIAMGVGINHADDNDGAQGLLQPFTAAARVALASDGADTRDVTVVGEVAGVLTSETVALNGASEVLTAATFDAGRLYHVYVASLSGTRTVTIRQGSGGTVRGTIGTNKKIAFTFLAGSDIDQLLEGFQHGNVAPSGVVAIWLRKTWLSGAGGGSGFAVVLASEGAA
jgi:hypothetical protein